MKPDARTGTVGWQSPANIALVKYWGKHGNQLPANPSVSMTLSRSVTTTRLTWSPADTSPGIQFLFDGNPNESFETRIKSYLESVKSRLPFLSSYNLIIESSNSFPHSSGISSSASFMSSLALCLCEMESVLSGQTDLNNEFYHRVSLLSRLGSGSASRSVYGKYALWGSFPSAEGSSDEFAIPVNHLVHPVFLDFRDAVLVVSSKPKPLSSSAGHALMNANPFANARYDSARNNLARMLAALREGDLDSFCTLLEEEALTLHGLILASQGGKILMEPGTLSIISRIRQFRLETGIPVAFTLDAGPNVHVLYPAAHQAAIRKFIEEELCHFCEEGKWIDDEAGDGPIRLELPAGPHPTD